MIVGFDHHFSLFVGSAKVQAQLRLEAESILINVAGRLLMFQRDRSASLGTKNEANDRRVNHCHSSIFKFICPGHCNHMLLKICSIPFSSFLNWLFFGH